MPDSSVLANFDPYDVACAVETYLRELDTRSIARVVARASQRLPTYYRTMIAQELPDGGAAGTRVDAQSFERLVERSRDDGALRDALIGCLKSNLRVIPLIGGSFADNIVRIVRNEELPPPPSERPRRAVLVCGALLMAVTAGAVGERFVERPSTPVVAQPTVAQSTPRPKPALHGAPIRRSATISQTKLPAATAPTVRVPVAAPASAPIQFAAPPTVRRARHAAAKPGRFPSGSGNASVAAAPLSVATQAPAQQTEPNMTDMPDATNATSVPAPEVSANPAAIPAAVRVIAPTATPAPRKRGLLRHLNPFRLYPKARPAPTHKP